MEKGIGIACVKRILILFSVIKIDGDRIIILRQWYAVLDLFKRLMWLPFWWIFKRNAKYSIFSYVSLWNKFYRHQNIVDFYMFTWENVQDNVFYYGGGASGLRQYNVISFICTCIHIYGYSLWMEEHQKIYFHYISSF